MKQKRFIYYLFLTVFLLAIVAWMRDLTIPMIFSAYELNRYLVIPPIQQKKRWHGSMLWLCCFSVLACAYFLLDLLLFPHSARAMFRSRDAVSVSLISMVGMLIGVFCSPRSQVKTSTRAVRS